MTLWRRGLSDKQELSIDRFAASDFFSERPHSAPEGRLPDAASWLRRALAEPVVSARSATMAHLELGKALERMGRCTEAMLEYQSAAAAPDFAGTRQEAQKWINQAACGAGKEK